ncbi:amidohydrolase [Taklimakanibacter lacteus]|uniref:amidohydrolase n=1 Tax=Taklimakanibacter lacteus TaxID=2268456 RepID=UPI000E672412
MIRRLGKKYQELAHSPACSNGCFCGDAAQWAGILSRRGFFLGGGAAVAATPLAFASFASPAAAQATDAATSRIPADLAKKVFDAIDADKDRLVEIYKDIHQNAELGFMEVRTAGIIVKTLGDLGFEVKTGIAQTGVAAILRNGDGPTVMYRADMDANAVEEATGLPYASKVRAQRPDGTETYVAHMCGHDAHVTWMLGLAKVMVENKDRWGGTLVLIGQPAEEPITGAKAMVDDGLYSKHGVPTPDYLLALHTAPIPTGYICARGGTVMAGTDQIDITFHGVGGHGSMPQMTKDPVIMGALAVMEYQMILSRVLNPLDTAVLTVGSFQAGSDNNVIPKEALLKLNLRFFDLKVREQMINGVNSINNGIASTYGMPKDQLPSVVMKGFSPPLVNDAKLAALLKPMLAGLLGEKQVIDEFPPATGSEDVHLLRGPHEKVPVAYMAVGVADPALFAEAAKAGKVFPYSAHNPDFRVDLNAIPVGAKVGTLSVLELMAKS